MHAQFRAVDHNQDGCVSISALAKALAAGGLVCSARARTHVALARDGAVGCFSGAQGQIAAGGSTLTLARVRTRSHTHSRTRSPPPTRTPTLSIRRLVRNTRPAQQRSLADVRGMIEGIDIDHDGMVDYTEFVAATMSRAMFLQVLRPRRAIGAVLWGRARRLGRWSGVLRGPHATGSGGCARRGGCGLLGMPPVRRYPFPTAANGSSCGCVLRIRLVDASCGFVLWIQQEERLHLAFEQFDLNHDGRISRAELESCLEEHHWRKHAATCFEELDVAAGHCGAPRLSFLAVLLLQPSY